MTVTTPAPLCELTKATTTYRGRGATAITSQSSCLRSSPTARRNRSSNEMPLAISPSPMVKTQTVPNQSAHGWIASSSIGFCRCWYGGSRVFPDGIASRNAPAPATTWTRATSRHRGDRDRPVGVSRRIRATSVNQRIHDAFVSTTSARVPGRSPDQPRAVLGVGVGRSLEEEHEAEGEEEPADRVVATSERHH